MSEFCVVSLWKTLCFHRLLDDISLCDLSSLGKQKVIDFVCSAFALLSDEKLEFTNVILILMLTDYKLCNKPNFLIRE